MTQACWHSEHFPASGASAGEGIFNQLGRPQLDLLSVLVREAAQNSWDARIGGQPVDFNVDVWRPEPEERRFLAEIHRDLSPDTGLGLSPAARPGDPWSLAITDTGTSGLGGPTRADVLSDVPRDFVAFIRNVGEPPDKEYGGGTYGFGKTIFYRVSGSQAIFIHTRCRVGDRIESRFIGAALGSTYTHDGRPFTGRHWWGCLRDGVVEPLLDRDADDMAHRLGMQFLRGGTGTTILMPSADFSELEPQAAAEAVADVAAWHLWPKMVVAETGAPEMRVSVRCQGSPVRVPDPAVTPPLDLFVRAFHDLQTESRLRLKSRSQEIGVLALRRELAPARSTDLRQKERAPFHGPSHHVALIRNAGLIVKYHEGPPLAGDLAEYAGVFRCDASVDAIFAASEPPTHDDWIDADLSGGDRAVLRAAYRQINSRLAIFTHVPEPSSQDASNIPLAGASRLFSSLLPAVPGAGPAFVVTNPVTDTQVGSEPGASSQGSPSPGQRHRSGTVRARTVGLPEFSAYAGKPVIFIDTEISGGEREQVEAVAIAGVLVDTGRRLETDPPTGSLEPDIVGWLSDGAALRPGARLVIDPGMPRSWRVLVSPVPNTLTNVEIHARVVGAS